MRHLQFVRGQRFFFSGHFVKGPRKSNSAGGKFCTYFCFFPILAGDGAINFEEFSKLVKSPKLRLDRSKKTNKSHDGLDDWSRFLTASLFQKDVGLQNL